MIIPLLMAIGKDMAVRAESQRTNEKRPAVIAGLNHMTSIETLPTPFRLSFIFSAAALDKSITRP